MTTFTCTPADTALLMIDLQERFLPAIPDMAADKPCGRNSVILATAARTLGLPVVISEQYPKGLGHTLPWIAEAAAGAAIVEKTAFSCCDESELCLHLDRLSRRTVVLCGVEAHVCVLSSAADLVARGFTVLVAADAVASRRTESRDQALAAMRDLGALVLPTESILFRLLRRAGTPEFKAISALVK
jgi:nicotinamidase-related amidase